MIYLTYPLSNASEFTKSNSDSVYISKELFTSQESEKNSFRDYVQYAIFVSSEYKNVFIDVDPEIAKYCNEMPGADKLFTVIIPHVSMYEEWKQRASNKVDETKNARDLAMCGHIVDFFASEIYLINAETFYLPKITITDKNSKLGDLL